MTPQNYYKRRRQRKRRQVDGELVEGLVKRERRSQHRLGVRKLHHLLKEELKQAGVHIGRDRMFEELRKRDLLLAPLPAQYPHTTQSYHNLPVFRNLVKERVVQASNEVWVSDLSYLRTKEGYLYLALITDKYSRKIVGRASQTHSPFRPRQPVLLSPIREPVAEAWAGHQHDREQPLRGERAG